MLGIHLKSIWISYDHDLSDIQRACALIWTLTGYFQGGLIGRNGWWWWGLGSGGGWVLGWAGVCKGWKRGRVHMNWGWLVFDFMSHWWGYTVRISSCRWREGLIRILVFDAWSKACG